MFGRTITDRNISMSISSIKINITDEQFNINANFNRFIIRFLHYIVCVEVDFYFQLHFSFPLFLYIPVTKEN